MATRRTCKDAHGEWRYLSEPGALTLEHQTGKDYVMEIDYRVLRGPVGRKSAVTVAEFDARFAAASDAPQ